MKYSELKIIFPDLKEVATGVDLEEKRFILTLEGVELVERAEVRKATEEKLVTLRAVKGMGRSVDEALADIAKALSEAEVIIGEIRYSLPTISL